MSLQRILIFLGLSLSTTLAFASSDIDSGDTAWILTSTALVLFMTIPGLAFASGNIPETVFIMFQLTFAASAFGGLGLAEGVTVASQFFVQLTAVLVTMVWCVGITYLALKFTALFVPLRVSEDDETEGLDLAQHNERGYTI
jgi:ammonia channel protein AmtB